jgi:phage-related minor tail protein
MTTCCPNCSSSAAVGNDLVSACTDCASIAVAGSSMSMTMIAGIAAGTIAIAIVARMIRHTLGGRLLLKRAHA